jgi:hypothetical protein
LIRIDSKRIVMVGGFTAFEGYVIEQNRRASAGKERDLNALLRKGDTETQIGTAAVRRRNELAGDFFRDGGDHLRLVITRWEMAEYW